MNAASKSKRTSTPIERTPAEQVEIERNTVLYLNERAERLYVQEIEEMQARLESLKRDTERDIERCQQHLEVLRAGKETAHACYAESVRSDNVTRIIESSAKLSAMHSAREIRLSITSSLGAAIEHAEQAAHQQALSSVSK